MRKVAHLVPAADQRQTAPDDESDDGSSPVAGVSL